MAPKRRGSRKRRTTGSLRGIWAGSQQQVEMIVRARRGRSRIDAQRARHAQVHQQPARRGVLACPRPGRVGRRQAFQQQILAASLDTADDAARQSRLQLRLDRPAQAPVAHDHVGNAAAHYVRQQSAPRDLDFRQFWHRPLVHPPAGSRLPDPYQPLSNQFPRTSCLFF
jgi:hypothetical protein